VNPRQLLADARVRTTQRLERLRAEHAGFVAASRDSNADDEHDPEGATIAFERSQVATLVREGEQHLDDIDAALARLDAGTYGSCERCGSPIPEGRLEARPTTRRCVGCAA
jgi:RNA polymerase-binding transcription factor DksA